MWSPIKKLFQLWISFLVIILMIYFVIINDNNYVAEEGVVRKLLIIKANSVLTLPEISHRLHKMGFCSPFYRWGNWGSENEGKKAQDYIHKWQERGSSPRLAQLQSPWSLKCQQVLRLCQSKTQQTWTWTMVARGLPEGRCAGTVWRGGQWNMRNLRGDREWGSRLSPAAPWPVWPWTSPWVKDSTNQAKQWSGQWLWLVREYDLSPLHLRTEPSSPPWPTPPKPCTSGVRSPAAGWKSRWR